MGQRITRRAAKVEEDNFEPEDAFMKIGFNLRQALKKHPPMGMLEGLEEKITDKFTTNPNSEFVCEDLSSFERLLLHALRLQQPQLAQLRLRREEACQGGEPSPLLLQAEPRTLLLSLGEDEQARLLNGKIFVN